MTKNMFPMSVGTAMTIMVHFLPILYKQYPAMGPANMPPRGRKEPMSEASDSEIPGMSHSSRHTFSSRAGRAGADQARELPKEKHPRQAFGIITY